MLTKIDSIIHGWEQMRKEVEKIEASHPGALEELFSHYDEEWTTYPCDSDGDPSEDDDLVLEAFFNTFHFHVGQDGLTAEYPYETIVWDPKEGTWMKEDDFGEGPQPAFD